MNIKYIMSLGILIGLTGTLVQGAASYTNSNANDGRESNGGDLERVRQLIDGDSVLLFEPNANGDTPLHITAQFGTVEAFKIIVEKNRSTLIQKNNKGLTPADVAAINYRQDIIEYISEINGGRTPLHDAAQAGNLALVDLLLENYPELHCQKDNQGKTPLDYVKHDKSAVHVRLLIASPLLASLPKSFTDSILKSAVDASSMGCANCATRSDNLKNCSQCKKVKYCSVQCQKSHWLDHKKDCQKKERKQQPAQIPVEGEQEFVSELQKALVEKDSQDAALANVNDIFGEILEKNGFERVKILIKQVCANGMDQAAFFLSYAVNEGNLDLLQYLVETACEIKALNAYLVDQGRLSRTPLYLALLAFDLDEHENEYDEYAGDEDSLNVRKTRLAILELLVKCGVPLDLIYGNEEYEGRLFPTTLLSMAFNKKDFDGSKRSFGGHFDAAKILVEGGAKIAARHPVVIEARSAIETVLPELQRTSLHYVLEHGVGDSCSACATVTGPLKSCSGCEKVMYCSKTCQKTDWKAHKKDCKKQVVDTNGAKDTHLVRSETICEQVQQVDQKSIGAPQPELSQHAEQQLNESSRVEQIVALQPAGEQLVELQRVEEAKRAAIRSGKLPEVVKTARESGILIYGLSDDELQGKTELELQALEDAQLVRTMEESRKLYCQKNGHNYDLAAGRAPVEDVSQLNQMPFFITCMRPNEINLPKGSGSLDEKKSSMSDDKEQALKKLESLKAQLIMLIQKNSMMGASAARREIERVLLAIDQQFQGLHPVTSVMALISETEIEGKQFFVHLIDKIKDGKVNKNIFYAFWSYLKKDNNTSIVTMIRNYVGALLEQETNANNEPLRTIAKTLGCMVSVLASETKPGNETKIVEYKQDGPVAGVLESCTIAQSLELPKQQGQRSQHDKSVLALCKRSLLEDIAQEARASEVTVARAQAHKEEQVVSSANAVRNRGMYLLLRNGDLKPVNDPEYSIPFVDRSRVSLTINGSPQVFASRVEQKVKAQKQKPKATSGKKVRFVLPHVVNSVPVVPTSRISKDNKVLYASVPVVPLQEVSLMPPANAPSESRVNSSDLGEAQNINGAGVGLQVANGLGETQNIDVASGGIQVANTVSGMNQSGAAVGQSERRASGRIRKRKMTKDKIMALAGLGCKEVECELCNKRIDHCSFDENDGREILQSCGKFGHTVFAAEVIKKYPSLIERVSDEFGWKWLKKYRAPSAIRAFEKFPYNGQLDAAHYWGQLSIKRIEKQGVRPIKGHVSGMVVGHKVGNGRRYSF